MRSAIAMIVATSTFFVITLDLVTVSVALAAIAQELGGGGAAQLWVLNAYAIALASLLLFGGSFSDRVGARRALTVGFVLLAVGAGAAALSGSIGMILIARCLQGVASALLLPASVALLRETFPRERSRDWALGVWASGGAVAVAIGPALGGTLVAIDWRLVFWANAPICVLMLCLLLFVTRSTRGDPAPFDWVGQPLAIISLVALTLALIGVGRRDVDVVAVVGAFVISVIAIAAFVLTERRVRVPMLPLDVLRPIPTRIAVAIGFSFMASWNGCVFVMSIYLQQHLHLGPLHAGLVFLPAALVSMVANVLSGPVASWLGQRAPVVFGQAVAIVGHVVLFASLPTGDAVLLAVGVALVGGGGALAVPPVIGIVLAHTSAEKSGIASGALNMFRQVGGACAIALYGSLLAEASSFVDAARLCFMISAGVVAVTLLLAARLPGADAAGRS